MEKNMKRYNLLITKLESILTSLHIEFEAFDCKDEESINYTINIPATGELSPLDSVICVLYLDESNCSMNLLVGNIYSIDNSVDPLPLYEVVNTMNLHDIVGKFMVLEDEGRMQIIYKSTFYCEKNFSELNSNLLKSQIDAFMYNLNNLFLFFKKSSEENS